MKYYKPLFTKKLNRKLKSYDDLTITWKKNTKSRELHAKIVQQKERKQQTVLRVKIKN